MAKKNKMWMKVLNVTSGVLAIAGGADHFLRGLFNYQLVQNVFTKINFLPWLPNGIRIIAGAATVYIAGVGLVMIVKGKSR